MRIINNLNYTKFVNVLLVVIVFGVFTLSFVGEQYVETNSGGKIEAIYNGDRQKNNVSIMINVYENKDVTKKMAKLFYDNGIKSTFFFGGCFADDNNDLLNYIVSLNHEIGNHGYFHKDHKKLSKKENMSEIKNNEKIIESLCGVKTKLFAPPSGSFSVNTLDVCYEMGYKIIMWSIDTIDWRDKDENIIYNRATKNVRGGDLILMHPKVHSLNVLQKIIDYYKSEGLSLVTVSENIGEL